MDAFGKPATILGVFVALVVVLASCGQGPGKSPASRLNPPDWIQGRWTNQCNFPAGVTPPESALYAWEFQTNNVVFTSASTDLDFEMIPTSMDSSEPDRYTLGFTMEMDEVVYEFTQCTKCSIVDPTSGYNLDWTISQSGTTVTGGTICKR